MPTSQRLASANQQHELTALIARLRQELAAWWALPDELGGVTGIATPGRR